MALTVNRDEIIFDGNSLPSRKEFSLRNESDVMQIFAIDCDFPRVQLSRDHVGWIQSGQELNFGAALFPGDPTPLPPHAAYVIHFTQLPPSMTEPSSLGVREWWRRTRRTGLTNIPKLRIALREVIGRIERNKVGKSGPPPSPPPPPPPQPPPSSGILSRIWAAYRQQSLLIQALGGLGLAMVVIGGGWIIIVAKKVFYIGSWAAIFQHTSTTTRAHADEKQNPEQKPPRTQPPMVKKPIKTSPTSPTRCFDEESTESEDSSTSSIPMIKRMPSPSTTSINVHKCARSSESSKSTLRSSIVSTATNDDSPSMFVMMDKYDSEKEKKPISSVIQIGREQKKEDVKEKMLETVVNERDRGGEDEKKMGKIWL